MSVMVQLSVFMSFSLISLKGRSYLKYGIWFIDALSCVLAIMSASSSVS